MSGGMDLERRYTLVDLDDMPEDGRRSELADGWLLVSPPELDVFSLPINVDDPDADATHFEPDLTVVRRACADIENGHVPLLAVEVRSPSTAGRGAVSKRRECARLRIASYWLLAVDTPSLRILELDGDDYAERAFAVADEPVSVSLPFPVTPVPARLMAP